MTENNQAAASEDDQDVGHGRRWRLCGFDHHDPLFLGAFSTTLTGTNGSVRLTLRRSLAGFGKIDGLTYIGKGGFGARQGFLFALSLFPSVMLALGVMEVVTYYGAMRAAQKLMTPLLNPILGVPGSTGLALITDLQSTDAGAALTKGMYDRGLFDKKGLIVVCAWRIPAQV